MYWKSSETIQSFGKAELITGDRIGISERSLPGWSTFLWRNDDQLETKNASESLVELGMRLTLLRFRNVYLSILLLDLF